FLQATMSIKSMWGDGLMFDAGRGDACSRRFRVPACYPSIEPRGSRNSRPAGNENRRGRLRASLIRSLAACFRLYPRSRISKQDPRASKVHVGDRGLCTSNGLADGGRTGSEQLAVQLYVCHRLTERLAQTRRSPHRKRSSVRRLYQRLGEAVEVGIG